MTRKILGSGVLALALLGLSGCAAFSDGRPSASNGLTVVAGLYPLQWMAQQVVGDHAQVEDLTQPGAEPHDLELTPKQVGDVVSADVIVYERGLQAAVDEAVGQANSAAAFDVTPVAGLEPLSHGGHDDVIHHAGVMTDQEAEQSAKDLGDLDPHFWQDPLKLARVGQALADRMASVDPADASSYHANADALSARLKALDHAYSNGLAHCQRHVIVVSHNAFGYLWRYGLDIEPIAGLSPDAEPTPADLGRLQQLIRTDGITTVFGERLVSPALARTIAHDTGARTAVLDPIEGLSDATSTDDYLSLMRANLAALRTANGCR